jgi:putative transcriptional regulator
MTDDILKGKLLVSQPTLTDPNFDRTVVLMLEHGEDGAIGVVLNRQSDVEMAEAVPAWADKAAQPARVFVGGPVVDEGTAICLARSEADETAAWKPMIAGLGTLDVNVEPDATGVTIDEIRLFAGYSGWGKGQLEMEIELGAWFVVDARPVDAFTADPEGLWKAVIGRQPGMLAWLATFPPDVSMN